MKKTQVTVWWTGGRVPTTFTAYGPAYQNDGWIGYNVDPEGKQRKSINLSEVVMVDTEELTVH